MILFRYFYILSFYTYYIYKKSSYPSRAAAFQIKLLTNIKFLNLTKSKNLFQHF